jgi:hypothetical protein
LGGVAIVNANCPEEPPPGDGFTTAISAVPAAAISAAVIEEVN